MDKARLVSHVAAETSTIRAAAERMVGAVSSAVADLPAREEPVATAGFGKFAVRCPTVRQERNPRTGEPVTVPPSKVPSFKPATALGDAVNESHDGAGGRMLVIRFRNAPAAGAYLRDTDLQDLVSSIVSQPDAPFLAGHRTAVHPYLAGYGTIYGREETGRFRPFRRTCERAQSKCVPWMPLPRALLNLLNVGGMRTNSDDSSARAWASQILKPLPRRLRPPSLAGRTSDHCVVCPARNPRPYASTGTATLDVVLNLHHRETNHGKPRRGTIRNCKSAHSKCR